MAVLFEQISNPKPDLLGRIGHARDICLAVQNSAGIPQDIDQRAVVFSGFVHPSHEADRGIDANDVEIVLEGNWESV
jgi:hypothetical protein